MASIILSSGTSVAPASIMITFSRVEATVRAKSEFSFSSSIGLNTSLPSTSPTCVAAIGPSNGISEIATARAEPSMATTSGLASGSTLITRLFNVTSFR